MSDNLLSSDPVSYHVVTERPDAFRRVRTFIPGESLTDQSFRDDCDIDLVVKRALKTGLVTHVSAREFFDGDFPPVDFQTAQDTIARANAAFYRLPAKLRAKFANNPGKFLEFANNPSNSQALKDEFGIIIEDVNAPSTSSVAVPQGVSEDLNSDVRAGTSDEVPSL